LEVGPDLLTAARDRFATRDYRGAVLLLDAAITAGRGYPDTHHLMGLCYALNDQREEALRAFDVALQLNPRYVEAHLNRAIVLGDLGRPKEAEEAIERAHHLGGADATGFPRMVADRLANMHAELGRAYREAGSLQAAATQFERALELRPTFADLRLALARTRLEAGDAAAAAADIDAVLEMSPTWLDAMLLRGLAAYLSGELDQAKAIWDGASERHPEEPRLDTFRSMLARRMRDSS